MTRLALAIICIVAVFACAPAVAEDHCVTNGVNLCDSARQVATELGAVKHRDGKTFKLGVVSAVGTQLVMHFTFQGDRKALEALLGPARSDPGNFIGGIDQVSQQGACTPPVKKLVVGGGTVEYVFAFPTGEVFHVYIAHACA